MGIDEDGEHAEPLVELNESHAAHVGGEIVDLVTALHGGEAGGLLLKIHRQILGCRKALTPVRFGLTVHGADMMPFLQELADKMSADKTAGPGDENSFVHYFKKSWRPCPHCRRGMQSADDADGRSEPRMGTDGTQIIGSFFCIEHVCVRN